jgi:spermidine synthase
VIVVDSPDPIGPAAGLFSADFYALIHAALKPDGIFVPKRSRPFIHGDMIRSIQKAVKALFGQSYLYLAHIPTYQHGMWSFTMGTKGHNPLRYDVADAPDGLRYYNRQIHKGAFILPQFVQDLVSHL